MEDERSSGGGFFDVESRSARRSLPPISLTASICVVLLLLVIAWSATRQVSVARNPPATPDSAVAEGMPTSGINLTLSPTEQNVSASSALADLGPQVIGTVAAQYAALQEKGAYTPETGAAVASQLAASITAPVSYKTYSISDITTTNDGSRARIQQYQADLRAALAPLAKNTTPEIAIFAAYVQTTDTKYLDQLHAVTQAYTDATLAGARVVVPREAIAQHIAILNAMGKFSATLKALAENASEPITTVALLQTYNDAERDMVISFNSFASYIVSHSKT